MGFCQVPKIQIGSKNTEQGEIQIYGKNADALILGDATHEGGDVKIYRDASGNLQLSVDADAASNAIALSVYGGVVAQNYLTVGQAALKTSYPFQVVGNVEISSGEIYISTTGKGLTGATNITTMDLNIIVGGSDVNTHVIGLRIDNNPIIAIQATGNGAGGIDAATKAIGLYGTTPATQHAAIADATDAPSAITQLNLLLAANRSIGLIAT